MTREDAAKRDLTDESLLRLLDEFEAGEGGLSEGRPAPADPAEARLEREYRELVGMLPCALDPAAAPPGGRERLLARVAAEGAAGGAGPRTAGLDLSARRRVSSASSGRPGAALRRWALPLAAGLSAVMLGVTLWLAAEVARQGERIARLSGELEVRQAAELRLASLEQSLSIVTAPKTELCALRPAGERPLQPRARGVLYVAQDHQHWYLAIHDLKPCERGRSYQLWFHAGGEAVSAGMFTAVPGEPVELGSETMPKGTRAVSVTIEPAGGSPQPSDQVVLHGNEVMVVL